MLARGIIFILIGAMLLIVPCHCGQSPRDLLLFCGSAAKIPMDEIVSIYSQERGNRVSVTYGGSGTLLSQMEIAGRGDVYLAGSPDYIALGERKSLLERGSARPVSWLIPSIIVQRGNPERINSLEDLARPGVRLGLGNPESVCLGVYAVEILEKNRLLEKVLPNTAVFAKSCEDTAMLVALHSVDAVIGWDVFAAWYPKEVERIPIPAGRIPRLSYMAIALPVFARDRARSLDFIAFVLSPRGRAIFRKWKYLSSEREARRYAPNAGVGGEYALPKEYFTLIHREK